MTPHNLIACHCQGVYVRAWFLSCGEAGKIAQDPFFRSRQKQIGIHTAALPLRHGSCKKCQS